MRLQGTSGKVQTETFVRNESLGDLKKRAQVRELWETIRAWSVRCNEGFVLSQVSKARPGQIRHYL
jgi:hypothetical protein